MPRASSHGVEIEYETFGDPEDPALLLVKGLGEQLVAWEVDFCEGLVDRGFFVLRFDNRDVGLSSKIDVDVDVPAVLARLAAGEEVEVPYHLSDMAADAIGVLDDMDIEAAHVAGFSLGGMIAQTMAIEHRDRLLSLTSISSTTGDPDVGQTRPETQAVLDEPYPSERDPFIQRAIDDSRLIGSPEHFEEDRVRRRAERSYDRCYWPEGVARQLLAMAASPSRSAALRQLDINALVLHGDADPLIDVSGGERTAETLSGSELVLLEGMGHDLPTYFWTRIIEGITNLASRSTATA